MGSSGMSVQLGLKSVIMLGLRGGSPSSSGMSVQLRLEPMIVFRSEV